MFCEILLDAESVHVGLVMKLMNGSKGRFESEPHRYCRSRSTISTLLVDLSREIAISRRNLCDWNVVRTLAYFTNLDFNHSLMLGHAESSITIAISELSRRSMFSREALSILTHGFGVGHSRAAIPR